MTEKKIGILDAFERLKFEKHDTLVLKADSMSGEDMMQIFAALKSKFGFDGFIIMLRKDETFETMSEEKCREIYKEWHERFGPKV